MDRVKGSFFVLDQWFLKTLALMIKNLTLFWWNPPLLSNTENYEKKTKFDYEPRP